MQSSRLFTCFISLLVGFVVEAVVPPNTTATAELPTDTIENIHRNGKPIAKVETELREGTVLVALQSGTHRIVDRKSAVANDSELIVPPEGGRSSLAFSPESKLEFEFQNVKAKADWVKVKEMPFSEFYQIDCEERFSDPSNLQLRIPIHESIKKGNVVLVSYWIRRPKAGGQPNNVYLSIGDEAGEAAYQNKLSAYRQWKQHVRSFVATREIDARADVVRFNLGEAGTMVEIADFRLLNYEKEYGSPKIYADIMAEARRLSPDSTHAINEGKVLPDGYKREPYKEIIRYLNEQGQPADIVGFMGHFGLTSLTPPEELLQVYDEFAEIAPRLQLSEFDVDAGDDEERL